MQALYAFYIKRFANKTKWSFTGRGLGEIMKNKLYRLILTNKQYFVVFSIFSLMLLFSAFLYPSYVYAAKFKIGDKVEVYNTGGVGLKLRKCASINDTTCPKLVTMPDGTQMIVLDGPYQSDGYTWWKLSGYVNSDFY
ncbi:MAG: hypothetical protein U0586_16235, partial [Candidatus Brocadiaceae bacterium]